jgi:hypothetical protein
VSVATIVATLPALHTLSLNGATIDDVGVAALAPLASRLRSLDIGNTRITDAACTTLAGMRRLDHLCLANSSAAGLRALAPLDELECLVLGSSNQMDDAAVRTLRSFPKLARLSLGGPSRITDACLDDLAALPELAMLNLTRTQITPAGIDRLATRAPKLPTVFVNACDPATIVRAKQIERWTVPDSVDGFDDRRDV